MRNSFFHVFQITTLTASLASGFTVWAEVPVESLNQPDSGSEKALQQPPPAQAAYVDTGTHSRKENSAHSQIGDMIVNLLNRVNDLQQQVQSLKGEIEVQAYTIKKLENQSKQRYIDVDKRLSDLGRQAQKINSTSTVSNNSSDNQETGSANTRQTDSQAYQAAFSLIGKQRFEQASSALNRFVNAYPDSQYVANAWYWTGEIYSATGKPEQALKAFDKVVKDYPKSTKIADAIYKVGIINAQQGRSDEAKKYLRQVIKKYPQTSAASLSKSYLETMEP